jgi:hypothetical protein
MKTADEAKRMIIGHLATATPNMTIADVVEWDLHVDENEDGTGNTVFVYFSWYGGSGLSSFEWPWDSATFDCAAYERFFASRESVK